MTPEAAQDLQAYFGMNLFGDEDDEEVLVDDEESKNNDMEEQKLRRVIREEIKGVLQEYGTDADPGRATAASGGGPGTEWYYIARLMNDLDRERREIKDIGQKEIGGETVHEFAANDVVFQIRKVQ